MHIYPPPPASPCYRALMRSTRSNVLCTGLFAANESLATRLPWCLCNLPLFRHAPSQTQGASGIISFFVSIANSVTWCKTQGASRRQLGVPSPCWHTTLRCSPPLQSLSNVYREVFRTFEGISITHSLAPSTNRPFILICLNG